MTEAQEFLYELITRKNNQHLASMKAHWEACGWPMSDFATHWFCRPSAFPQAVNTFAFYADLKKRAA